MIGDATDDGLAVEVVGHLLPVALLREPDDLGIALEPDALDRMNLELTEASTEPQWRSFEVPIPRKSTIAASSQTSFSAFAVASSIGREIEADDFRPHAARQWFHIDAH